MDKDNHLKTVWDNIQKTRQIKLNDLPQAGGLLVAIGLLTVGMGFPLAATFDKGMERVPQHHWSLDLN